MIELFIQALRTDEAGVEDSAVTRERLKEIFPKLASRRMTQLGLVVGSTLLPLAPRETDTLIYASEYAETRALEGYLDSFPTASPTLFQTSIHPSAVQQALIGRQQPVREFFPLSGRAHLVARALQTAWLVDALRVLLCGGEERGTWLLERGTASARTFGFTLALTRDPAGALGRLALTPTNDPANANDGLALADFFDALLARRGLDVAAAPDVHLMLSWS
jgi:hypothetical protein